MSTRNISSKSVHAFLINLANSQTDRQTNKHGQKHVPTPLSKVIIIVKHQISSASEATALRRYTNLIIIIIIIIIIFGHVYVLYPSLYHCL